VEISLEKKISENNQPFFQGEKLADFLNVDICLFCDIV